MGLSTVLLALVLPALAGQQVPPGGPGGGGGSWKIEYQLAGSTQQTYTAPGISPTSSSSPWDYNPTQWHPGAAIPGFAGDISTPGSSITGSCSGTVKVRIGWTGQGAAPNHVWLKVDSSASWSGDSGECSNGQNDAAVLIQPGPGETRAGTHIIRKAYAGQPIVLEVGLSASTSCSTLNRPYSVITGLVVTVTDRSAILARGDGGLVALEDDTYTANTLLSWSGVHDGVDYGALPDGGPGITSQTLTGTVSGAWSTKQFTNPQTQQPYTTSDLTIGWGGSTTGTLSLTPPNPLTVLVTTYQGNMPQFDPTGTTPKEETWTYKIKDNQDGATLDLKWKWVAHFAHENWEATAPDPERPEYDVLEGGSIWTQNLSSENPSAYGSVQAGSMSVSTMYEGGTPSGIPGFTIRKHHIGIEHIRSAFGRNVTKYYDAQNVELNYNPIYGAGQYSIRPVAKAPLQRGTITVWNKKGQSGLGAMRFASCDDYVLTLEQFAPGEGS